MKDVLKVGVGDDESAFDAKRALKDARTLFV
jgi:hypothetical protein